MNSTNSLIRPPPVPPPPGSAGHRPGRYSTGSQKSTGIQRKNRDSKRLSGHCAVERTVTQITYCSDNADNATVANRDSGLVSGSGPESA